MVYWFENNNNNIGKNIQDVFLLSGVSSVNHGLYVEPFNIRRSVCLYMSRRLVSTASFINRDDVYLALRKK
jgi:hypothetical protein